MAKIYLQELISIVSYVITPYVRLVEKEVGEVKKKCS
jgi:hypothetical protein